VLMFDGAGCVSASLNAVRLEIGASAVGGLESALLPASGYEIASPAVAGVKPDCISAAALQEADSTHANAVSRIFVTCFKSISAHSCIQAEL
jgi:hypothetical protein